MRCLTGWDAASSAAWRRTGWDAEFTSKYSSIAWDGLSKITRKIWSEKGVKF